MLRFRYTEKYSGLQNICGSRNQGEGEGHGANAGLWCVDWERLSNRGRVRAIPATCSGLAQLAGRRPRYRVVQTIVDGCGQERVHLLEPGHES